MKTLTSLIGLASITLAVFFALLLTSLVSLPAFLAVAMAWFLLMAVHSYMPRTEFRLPRRRKLMAIRPCLTPSS